MHCVNRGEAFIAAHTIKELINEFANAGLTAGRLKRGIADPVSGIFVIRHSRILTRIRGGG
jgi:hypothetical protein